MIYNLDELARRQLIDYKHVNPGTCFGEENFAIDADACFTDLGKLVLDASKANLSLVSFKPLTVYFSP